MPTIMSTGKAGSELVRLLSEGGGTTSQIVNALEKERTLADEFSEIREEIARATAKFPGWPNDPLHALAVLQEEVGELTQAVLDASYDFVTMEMIGQIRREAIQVAAMAVRFLASVHRYDYKPAPNHVQGDEPRADTTSAVATCTGCDSTRMMAIRAVMQGKQACCPDCSTLTIDERNEIRRGMNAR